MMDLINYRATNPVVLMLMAAALLFFVYFILKQLLWFALICGLVLIGLGGYYFDAPFGFPVNAEKAVITVTETTRSVLERGKAVLDKSGDVAGKIIEKGEGERKQSSKE